MSTTMVTVLDHIDKITVDGNVFEHPVNEYWALLWLRHGLEFLYRQAVRCDQTMKQQVNPQGNLKYLGMGNLPDMMAVPMPMLTCAFHWYAISACQYVRTVGTIAYRQDNTRPKSADYATVVIPEAKAFRDKVAAHFAWSTQHKNDNEAERLASILPTITFVDDSFYMGEFIVTLTRDGKTSSSGSLAPWSICKVHERLRERYWPEADRGADLTSSNA